MLSVNDLSVGYKGVPAVHEASFQVNRGEIVSLVGSNGAGKTTILKAIAGLLQPSRGGIVFDGATISGQPAHEVVKQKIVMVPEGRRLFPRLSVHDNLLLGAYTVESKAEIEESLKRMWIMFPRLDERRQQRAGTLSGGEQQQLAIARGLMSRPALIMLDEPSLGIMPKLLTEIFDTIVRISQEGVTVLLVEQNVYEALQVSHRAYVLQTGRIVLEGAGKELLDSDLVRQAYLGM